MRCLFGSFVHPSMISARLSRWLIWKSRTYSVDVWDGFVRVYLRTWCLAVFAPEGQSPNPTVIVALWDKEQIPVSGVYAHREFCEEELQTEVKSCIDSVDRRHTCVLQLERA